MCRTYLPNTQETRLAVPERAFVPLPQLWEWVDNEVVKQLQAGHAFTAYGITRLLRVQHPDCQIVHTDVQARVHARMACTSHYTMTWQVWNGEPARTYAPVCVVSSPPPDLIAAPVFNMQAEPAALSARSIRIDWDEKDD